MIDKQYTTKQMGDACEMLVVGHMTLAGVPSLKVPDNWPDYDVIAHPANRPLQRVSVKSCTWKEKNGRVSYKIADQFEWLAIVIVDNGSQRFFLAPRAVADAVFYGGEGVSRILPIDKVPEKLGKYESNFRLDGCDEQLRGQGL